MTSAYKCLVVLGIVCVGALPASGEDNSRVGPYLGGSFHLGVEDFPGGGFGLNPGFGGQGVVGYRVFDWLSGEFEIAYTHFETDELFGNATIEFDFLTYTANARIFVLDALGEGGGRFQPYVKFGLGGMHVDAEGRGGITGNGEGDGFAIRLGGGSDLYVSDHVLLYFDVNYTLPFGDDLRDGSDAFNLVVFGLGAAYRF